MPTLIDFVKSILVEIDGDEVNVFSDSYEAEKLAYLTKHAFEHLINKRDWPHTRRGDVVQGRSDVSFPSHLEINENCKNLEYVAYDSRKLGETKIKYKQLKYISPDEFLYKTNKRNSDLSEVVSVVDDTGVDLLIRNDKAPEYFTSFNDMNVVCDSFDSVLETSLQTSKLQSYGFVLPVFEITELYEIDLPEEAISLLREEVISRSQIKLRQMEDVKSEQAARTQNRWLSRNAWKVGDRKRYPDYGK